MRGLLFEDLFEDDESRKFVNVRNQWFHSRDAVDAFGRHEKRSGFNALSIIV
jgi:hypothetical protein